MSPTSGVKSINLNYKLSRIKMILEDNDSPVTILRNFVDGIFEEIGSINDKLVATNHLQLNYPDWIGCTALHLAVKFKNEIVFCLLLDKGADFSIKTNEGDTALHLAFKDNYFNSHIKNMKVLMTHLQNSNLENISDNHGFSYFHIVCMVNDVKLVQRFLANGVSIDQVVLSESPFCPGYTPLHFAVDNYAFEVAEILLLHGANIHAKNSNHMSPLHQLLENNINHSNSTTEEDSESLDPMMKRKMQKILGLLLKTYSNTELIIIDDIGISNLHVACTLDDLTTAKSILKKCTNINHCIKTNSHQWQGYTALHFAALSYNVEAVKLLMKNSADIELKDAKGVTAFDLCMKTFGVEDIHAIISLNLTWRDILLSDGQSKLLDLVWAMRSPNELDIFLKQVEGQDFISKFDIPNDSALWPGFSLMHLATALSCNIQEESSQETSFPLLRAIFQQYPTMLQSQDIHGWTPLHLACRLDKQNIVDLFIEFHIFNNNSANLVDEDGLSYLHIACAKKNRDFLKKLLLNNSNIDTVYRGKSAICSLILPQTTALHIAVANNSLEMAEAMVEHGADVNTNDANDMTQIHWSLTSWEKERIGTILLSSSNLRDSVVNEIGLNHLHVAAYLGDRKALERLVACGANINQILNSAGKFKHLSRYEGFTPLAFAFKNRISTNAKYLIEHGADILVKMPNGNLLLYEMINNNPSALLPYLSENIILQNRVRIDIGLTELHLACFNTNYDAVKNLLDDGADVNAQIYKNSPSFSRFTPLHFYLLDSDEEHDEILELLIYKGADVTLLNGNSETPILMPDITSSVIQKLLEAQRDYSINPTNNEGLTHFHIACDLCIISVIEKFLKSGNVDVNQQIDFFADLHYLAGATPLQLALDDDLVRVTLLQRLQAAKLLLSHGADANAKTLYYSFFPGSVRSKSFDLAEMLVRYGSDVNARSWEGKSAFEYLTSPNIEDVKALLRFGCKFNIFNISTGEGCVGRTLKSMSYKAMRNLIPAITMNFSHLIECDAMDRTVIHNIVSVGEFDISAYEYATLIEELTLIGCDIDDRDREGKSALHLAAKFHNFSAISGLLMAGADVNTADFRGKTAFTCDFAVCNRDNGCENGKCKHYKMFKTFAVHVKKLQLCGLDVHPLNENLASQAYQNFSPESTLSDNFFQELEDLKNEKIGLYSLTLFDFMSENRAIVHYPSMFPMKRTAVENCFSQTQTSNFREKFSETSGILQLQYRKAVARLQLLEGGKNSLTTLIGFQLPDVCSELICKFLSNSDLKTLILTRENL